MEQEKNARNQKWMMISSKLLVGFSAIFRSICALFHFFHYFSSRWWCLIDAMLYSFSMLPFGFGLQLYLYSEHHSSVAMGMFQGALGGALIYSGHNLVLSQATGFIDEFFDKDFRICSEYERNSTDNATLFTYMDTEHHLDSFGYISALWGARCLFALPYIFACLLLETFVKKYASLDDNMTKVRDSVNNFHQSIQDKDTSKTAVRRWSFSEFTGTTSNPDEGLLRKTFSEVSVTPALLQQRVCEEEIRKNFLNVTKVNLNKIYTAHKAEKGWFQEILVTACCSLVFVGLINIIELALEYGLGQWLYGTPESQKVKRVLIRIGEAAVYVGLELSISFFPGYFKYVSYGILCCEIVVWKFLSHSLSTLRGLCRRKNRSDSGSQERLLDGNQHDDLV